MKKGLLVLAAVTVSMICYGAGSRDTGIQRKKDALERKYQKCMRYSRYKENCQKYQDIKNSIK